MLRLSAPALIALAALLAACGGSSTKPPAPIGPMRITSFTADPMTIQLGGEVTLSWKTEGTRGVDIEPHIGLADASGSATDTPISTTTYTLTIPGGPADLTSQVTVNVTGGPPVVDQFTAMPRTIALGESSVLSWKTTNAESVTIDPGGGSRPPSGMLAVMPMGTTTYRLTAIRGAQASPTQQVVVVVASGNQPKIRSFAADPQTISQGDRSMLSWQVDNATSVTIDNGVGMQPSSGSVAVMPAQTTIYTLTAIGPGGTAMLPVTVTVNPAGQVSITRFTAVPATIPQGGTSTLAWDTMNARGVNIDNGIGAQPAKGSIQVHPAQTTTYLLTALGDAGSTATQRVQVTVAQPNAPVVVSFRAQPSALLQGAQTTLSWTTQNATAVDIDNGVGMNLPPNGSVQVAPNQTITYTLTARGQGGLTDTQRAMVTVSPPPAQVTSFTAQPPSIVRGTSAQLSWQTSHATSVTIDNGVGAQATSGTAMVSPTQNTVYTLTADGPGGRAMAMVTVSVMAPGAPAITAFTSTPQQITPGAQAMLSWNVTGATTVTIDNGIGTVAAMGTRAVSPAATTTYTLNATGPGGTASAQVTVQVQSVVGQTCSQAFVVSGSTTFMGNTQQSVDTYSDAASCTGFTETGPDQVYKVTLQAGDRLQAVMTPTGTPWDCALYAVTSCANISQSCVAGSDRGGAGMAESLDFTAAMAGDYYMIADGYAGAGGTYALQVTITPAPVANALCSGAVDVGRGGTFMGDTTNSMNSYDPGSGGCTGFAETGKDVTYKVTLAAGERLQATLDAPWDSALYAVTDCTSVASSCVAGSDSGNPEHIDYTAAAAGTYYLIVDGYGTAHGLFTLTVMVSPAAAGGATCSTAISVPASGGSFRGTTAGLPHTYDPPTSCTGFTEMGADQVYSVSLGLGDVVLAHATFDAGFDGALFTVTDCSNLMSCVAGADKSGAGQPEDLRWVAQTAGAYYLIVSSFAPGSSGGHDLTISPYTGATCMTAPPLDVGGTPEFYTTAGKQNNYSPNSGGCTGFAESGPDRAYALTVNAGDQLQATLHPVGYDGALYAVSNCADINGSCIAGSDQVVVGDESIFPVFQQAGTYYVIADGFGGASGSGTLTAQLAHGDVCADAYKIPAAGGVFSGTTSGYHADYGTADPTTSCTGYTQLGLDAVYRVDLPPQKTITASLNTTWDSALYLITDCAMSATTCVTGSDSGNPEHITYQNTGTSTRTYWLVVDSWQLSDASVQREGPYTLTISVN